MSFDALATVKADTNDTALAGTLIRYGDSSSQLAFATGLPSSMHLIQIGGLGSGLDFNEYCRTLSLALPPKGWAVIQIQLKSAYGGYGVACLDQDAKEMHMLVQLLRKEFGAQTVVLQGHSTGCQDSVRYMQKYGKETGHPAGVILQASASDREGLVATVSNTPELMKQAREMMAKGQGEDILTRDWDGGGSTPITAHRYLSFTEVGGDDDMFSSDLSDAQLKDILGPCSRIPTYIVFSGKDQYVPETVDKVKHVNRLKQALGPLSRSTIIEGANHELEGRAEEFAQLVEAFLADITDSSTT